MESVSLLCGIVASELDGTYHSLCPTGSRVGVVDVAVGFVVSCTCDSPCMVAVAAASRAGNLVSQSFDIVSCCSFSVASPAGVVAVGFLVSCSFETMAGVAVGFVVSRSLDVAPLAVSCSFDVASPAGMPGVGVLVSSSGGAVGFASCSSAVASTAVATEGGIAVGLVAS